MGFKALNQAGDAIYSFTMDDYQWKEFKSNHKQQYKMSCCDAVAIPKTSKYGTQFFAHKANGCGASESIEHQFCKYLILKTLIENGFDAKTEVRFNDGEFIADVYADINGKATAFEVQWSDITMDEINRRNKKYKNNNIDCYWFFYGDKYVGSKDLMLFPLFKSASGDFTVGDIKKHGSSGTVKLPICNVVRAICSGRVMFLSDTRIYARIGYKRVKCNSCGSYVKYGAVPHYYSELGGVSSSIGPTGIKIDDSSLMPYQTKDIKCHCGDSKLSNGFSRVLDDVQIPAIMDSIYDHWLISQD